jgi:hypothetical protein
MTPVFFTFRDREEVFDLCEACCGDRMHPNWLRIGGCPQDIPAGWGEGVRAFLDKFPAKIKEYESLLVGNPIFERRLRDMAGHGVDAEAIHGNKSQNARQRALDGFKAGRLRVLVATDIAARGIDVDGISHVINFELPHEPESYVHRIGRTGRAGAAGIALSFCDSEERGMLRDIERLTRIRLTVDSSHAFVPNGAPTAEPPRGNPPPGRSFGSRPGYGAGRPRNDRSRGNDRRAF